MSRLELRAVIAGLLAATVVLGAVVCAAFGWTIVASALAIYALAVGAWLYHCVERLIVARRISTVRSAAKPLQPLLPVMAAIMGLTQAVVRSLSDVTELPARRWDLPVLRWVDGTRANRRIVDADGGDDGITEST
ncbi:antitermination protein NusB [Mycobacterium scrofulaceum]|uniref:Antitermination protein NusB n=1 Tax=Mycobacterium scrofulaceum TaxID=1783 RepID=A0A1A2TEJ0_MYCSC|nr:antitermination protein NusB [Mycobacterium scrofulaceum]OBH74804.1 antitermination protein NusB [Mycobacterium scrofulaceum]OBI09038.1 antitermination protein NusB [Mycobacterium scrofulaceum]